MIVMARLIMMMMKMDFQLQLAVGVIVTTMMSRFSEGALGLDKLGRASSHAFRPRDSCVAPLYHPLALAQNGRQTQQGGGRTF